ncbi:type III secretion apparatus assembly protein SctX [Bordetella bronchiseptica]
MSGAVPGMHAMHLGLERGVDHIVRGPLREPAPALPPERWLEPPDTGAVDHLKALLVHPDLTAMLDESARPRLTDGALLQPAQFGRTLAQARDELSLAMQLHAGNATPALSRALRVLDEAGKLRDLAAMYRSALYQG